MTTHEEPLDWMFEKELQELGLMPKRVDDKIKQDSADKNPAKAAAQKPAKAAAQKPAKAAAQKPAKAAAQKPAKAAVNREPRDTSWYHRGEECPH